jgi:hypothetical protein
VDYFQTRTLEQSPDGSCTNAASYNLARCHETLGILAEAEAAVVNVASIGRCISPCVDIGLPAFATLFGAQRQSQFDAAAELYRAGNSPQRHGDLVRARRLENAQSESPLQP